MWNYTPIWAEDALYPTFYRVIKGEDDITGEILGDFDTEEDAYIFAENYEGSKVIAILSRRDYEDLWPSIPVEL